MKRITWIFLFSLFSLFSFQTAFAKTITVHFNGNVSYVNGTSGYSAGDAVEGTFVLDDSTPNSSPYPEHAEYRMLSPLSAQKGFTSLKVGNETFFPDPIGSDATVFVANDIYPGPNGLIDDVSFDLCCQAGTFTNGDTVNNMHIIFNDDSNNPLSSNDLSAAMANLSNFKNIDMGINGSSFTAGYYDIQIKINTISVDGASSAANGPKNLVAFDSVVTRIDDPSGQTASLVREGDSITGNFTFDPNLVAMNPPNPEFAYYQAPGDDKNNISINFAGQTIVTNLNSDFKIEIHNYEPEIAGADRFFVSATLFNPIPLMNGSVIEDLRVEFINPPAQNLTSTDLLSSTPSDLSKWYVANLIINGRNPDGSFFNIKAALSDLVQGASSVTPMKTEDLFPASGTTQMHQQFEAMIIFDSIRAPITRVYSKLMNARGYTHNRCGFDGFTMTNQQRVLCYGISNDLTPGMNVLRIAVHFADGSKKYYLNRWNVID